MPYPVAQENIKDLVIEEDLVVATTPSVVMVVGLQPL
jgi:hypothetical protein